MFDLALRSTQTVLPAGTRPATVLIQKGRIAGIADHSLQPDCPVTDLGQLALMPGIIDPHVHINEPGRTDWEGFETATRAALAGGITTLVDMPLNSSPVTTSLGNFQKKKDAAQSKLNVNVGFWGGIVPGNQGEIEKLIAGGVLGFKAFLTHSGIDEFPNATEADLRQAMPILARHGLPLLVHCELSEENGDWLRGDTHSYRNYLSSRPKAWEDRAIAMMIRLCRETGCRTHIVHLSSADSIDQIRAAKAEGLPLTVETGQHYLFFHAEDIPDARTDYKCAPPVREQPNNEQLWAALMDGTIDFVATDHSPAPPDMKHFATGDFAEAWGGIASLQFAFPALWTPARERSLGLEDMARWLSGNPARLAGVHHRKGSIAVGYDADLAVIDPERSFVLTQDMIQHRHKVTPYLGLSLYGVIERTYLSGMEAYRRPTFAAPHKGQILTH